MTRYVYGRAWNVNRWGMHPFTEAEARVRYSSDNVDDWFAVAAFHDDPPEGAVPDYVMEILPRGEYFKVFFYDTSRSLRFIYGFGRIEDQLFMSSVVEYTYADQERQYLRSDSDRTVSVQYETTGVAHERIRDKVAKTLETADYRNVDVSRHWEPVPEFGDWESVARFDRRG